ncbi:S-adenosyl-L-methionine-dependent methyltransferase [Aspergillus steynii IBT 23096]|uniref:S-adenosyl-L-methionine-dependent methyltransferase n=1 Tax=Aspergillus steynii IBT 23096 TaxID=1392250 RepID=A0A2I2GDV1_9EURO|nr:S-adenosyl-L-methionine-dependent methyltransferase [Aspergillus steynii IBT 23096]PLB51011.1 S-adenosyl-L-methionine-dependent methyltransferase [Aspergillus steynii IBT 23096]
MSLEQNIESQAQALHSHIFSQPQDQYTNKPWALVTAIDAFAFANKMMTYRDEKIQVSKQQLERMQTAPRTLLEFGTYVGSSAIAWGAILRDLHGETSRVYTFELSAVNAQIARDFVRLAGLQDIVHVVEGRVRSPCADVVFFDHWEKFYVPDLKIIEELGLLRKGGLAIADNTDMPGAPKYVEYVKGSARYQTEEIDIEELKPWPSIVMVSTVVSDE